MIIKAVSSYLKRTVCCAISTILGFVLCSSQFFTILSLSHQAVLLVLIFVLKKKKKLAVELLWVTNKAISSSPFLLFQPLWTCAILVFFWVLWVAVLLSLGTAGKGSGLHLGVRNRNPHHFGTIAIFYRDLLWTRGV